MGWGVSHCVLLFAFLMRCFVSCISFGCCLIVVWNSCVLCDGFVCRCFLGEVGFEVGWCLNSLRYPRVLLFKVRCGALCLPFGVLLVG